MSVEKTTRQQRTLIVRRRRVVILLVAAIAILGFSIERTIRSTRSAAQMATIMVSALQQERSFAAQLQAHAARTSDEARSRRLFSFGRNDSRLQGLTEQGLVLSDAYTAARANSNAMQVHIDRNRVAQAAWGVAAAFMLTLTVFASTRILVLSRRISVDHPQCLPCGYNLTGNTSGACPECGRQLER